MKRALSPSRRAPAKNQPAAKAAASLIGPATIAASFALASAPAAAQELAAQGAAQTRLYLRVGAGVNFSPDRDQDLAFNPDLVFVGGPPTGRRVDTGPGVSFTAAAGFDYPAGTRTELEYRRIGSTVDAVTTFGGGAPGTLPGAGNIRAHALMSNVYKHFETGSAVRPYIGAGVGGVFVEDFTGARDSAFAYQGRAGLAIALGRDVSANLEYVHLRSLELEFGPASFTPGGPAGPRIDGASFVSSSVLLSFSRKF